LRHGLETFKKRLICLEERAAQEGIVYTEAQLVALEQAKREKETDPEEIETHTPLPDRPGHPVRGLPQGSGADLSAVGATAENGPSIGPSEAAAG
jgi:hypothetical protein